VDASLSRCDSTQPKEPCETDGHPASDVDGEFDEDFVKKSVSDDQEPFDGKGDSGISLTTQSGDERLGSPDDMPSTTAEQDAQHECQVS